MALSVSGFPEPLRQLDTDDASLNPLQRGLNLFAKKRQNTDDSLPDLVPEPSPISSISSAEEFATMSILQPPPVIPSSLQRPRQISLTRRTPPPQRQPSVGRLEIGSVPNRPSLPKPPAVILQAPQEQQALAIAHPRPLPALPAPVSQGPIIESSKSAAMRATAALPNAPTQPPPRPPASRVLLAGPSRPRAQTTVPHTVGVRYQPMAVVVDPTETPGASSSSSILTSAPTPTLALTPQVTAATTSASVPSGPRPLPRIPPTSTVPMASPTPVPAPPMSAAALSSHLQSPYVPRPPRVKRPKTSPSSSAGFGSAVRSPFDAVPSSWASLPVDLHPSGPSTSNAHSSGSGTNAHASGSGSNANVYASGSGSNAHASGSGTTSSGAASGSGSSSMARSLPRPRSHSRTRDQSSEASGSRSRGAASPIRRAPFASGSNSAPLPSSPGAVFTSGSGSGNSVSAPSSRRTSNASNPPTPRSSIHASTGISSSNRSPKPPPRIPSLPPPKPTNRALPTAAKIIKESSITSVSKITVTAPAPPPSNGRSHSVGRHPTSILKNSKSRGTTKRTLQLHNPPESKSPSIKSHKHPFDADADSGMIIEPGDSRSFISRSPSPMRYARPASRESFYTSDDDAHPEIRSRSRSRTQPRSFRRSFRPKPLDRSPSPIAYAKRSSVDMDTVKPEMLLDVEDDDEADLRLSPRLRRHTQPRSYQFDYRGPGDDGERELDRERAEPGSRKDSKDSKEVKEREGGAWDAMLKTTGLVRKRSKSKASSSQTASKDSGSGTTASGTPNESVIDIIDISSPTPTNNGHGRSYAPNQSNPSLDSWGSEEASSLNDSMKGSKKGKRARRPTLPPSIPPLRSPTSSSSARTRTMSDVSAPSRARVKSEGHGHRARLSGVLPGITWGAEVNTTGQWSDVKRLVPLRAATYTESEDNHVREAERKGWQRKIDLDLDMIHAIPVLRRMKAR